MGKENISQEFTSKNVDETRKYFNEKIKQSDFMNKKHKKVCTTLNYIEHLLMLASAVIGCASVSAICFSIELTSSGVGLNNCATTAVIKKYKPIIEKRKRSMIDILLAKP